MSVKGTLGGAILHQFVLGNGSTYTRYSIHSERSSVERRWRVLKTKFSTMYCILDKNGTREVVIAPARRDHRKSKFGLRHGLKLIELYAMTKSEF